MTFFRFLKVTVIRKKLGLGSI